MIPADPARPVRGAGAPPGTDPSAPGAPPTLTSSAVPNATPLAGAVLAGAVLAGAVLGRGARAGRGAAGREVVAAAAR